MAAMEGKKGKKGKTTIPLTEFLRPQPDPLQRMTSWADEVDTTETSGVDSLEGIPILSRPAETKKLQQLPEQSSYHEPAVFPVSVQGNGPPLPDRPPYKAFIGNIPYNLQERDLESLFRDLTIRDILIIKHRDTGNPKGCFVEFDTREQLATATQRDGTVLMGRALRIDIAEGKPERKGSRFDFNDDRGYDRDRGGRDYGRRDDRGGAGDYGGGFGGRRREYEPSDDGYGRREERGPRSGFGDRDRRNSPPRGSRYEGFSGRRVEEEGDRWGRRAPPPPPSGPAEEPQAQQGEEAGRPAERPKLTLAPRSAAPAGDTNGGPPAAKSNPFGAAKPVDTVAKLKELEERDARQKAEEAARRRAEAEEKRKAAEAEAGAGAGAGPKSPGRPAEADIRAGPSLSTYYSATSDDLHAAANHARGGDHVEVGSPLGRGRGRGRAAARGGRRREAGEEGGRGRGRGRAGGRQGRWSDDDSQDDLSWDEVVKGARSGRERGREEGGRGRGPRGRGGEGGRGRAPPREAGAEGWQGVPPSKLDARKDAVKKEAADQAPVATAAKEEPPAAAVQPNMFDLLNEDD